MANDKPILGPATCEWLLALARRTIGLVVLGDVGTAPSEVPKEAAALCGCFVSLHAASGDLRGCIGTFEASEPLWRNVMDMAAAAATNDPRFPAVSVEELSSCVIEISALSPRREATAADVVVGEHGLWISRRSSRGVLLPQVATERGWDRETFLEHTCQKAGLPRQAWREPDTRIEVFTAQVFGEPRRLG